MSIPKMAKAMGYIDDDLVTGAVEYKRTKKKNSWMKWGKVLKAQIKKDSIEKIEAESGILENK